VESGGGEAGSAVVSLDVVEEDVARSRTVYCDQCRVVGELTQLELLKNALFFLHAFSSLAIRWSGRETRELSCYVCVSLSLVCFFFFTFCEINKK
jgi:hypothetical protein